MAERGGIPTFNLEDDDGADDASAAAAPGLPAAPKLSLASPPLKKSKSVVITGSNDEQTDPGEADLEPAFPPPPLLALPAADTAMGPLEQQSLHTVLNQWAERLENTLSRTVGRKLDAIQANQQVVLQTVDAHTSQISSLAQGLDGVKAKIQKLEASPPQHQEGAGSQVQQLQKDLRVLTDKVDQLSSLSARAPSAPPPQRDSAAPVHDTSRRARSAAPFRRMTSDDAPLIDWNHLVIGGWGVDTRRDTIHAEATQLLEKMQASDKVVEVIVYGKRSSTCHVFLQPLPEPDARQQILSWQAQFKDKFVLPSSGKPAWLTAHKSTQLRFKNRITKQALHLVQTLLGQGSTKQVDCDWARQLIWVDDCRVAGARIGDFDPEPNATLCEHNRRDDKLQQAASLHFHASRLARVTGKTVPDIQQFLAQPRANE